MRCTCSPNRVEKKPPVSTESFTSGLPGFSGLSAAASRRALSVAAYTSAANCAARARQVCRYSRHSPVTWSCLTLRSAAGGSRKGESSAHATRRRVLATAARGCDQAALVEHHRKSIAPTHSWMDSSQRAGNPGVGEVGRYSRAGVVKRGMTETTYRRRQINVTPPTRNP